MATGRIPINGTAAIQSTIVDAKGDLIVGTGADAVSRLAVGTDTYTLVADSSEATGLKWATPATASFVGARAAKPAGDQSITNDTNTTVTWTGTDVFDTDAFHDTSTNTGRLTIPSGKDGYYKIYWTVQWGSANATGRRTCQLYKNGGATAEISGETTPNGSTFPTISGSVTMNLVATDFVELKAYQNSGGSLNLSGSGGSPVFGLEKIG